MRRCVSRLRADMDPAIIGGGLNLLGSLFGRKKTMTPARSILSTARGVRMAAKETGLNALTLLGASNATAGAGMDMGPSPLASLSVLGGIIQDEFSDEAKTRKEHNKLQNQLLRLEVDRARTLVQVPSAPAVNGVGGGRSALGGNTVATIGAGTGVAGGRHELPALTADRVVKQTPTEDISGFMKVRNAWTDKDGFWVPGSDGEPLDIWQVPVVAGSWAASEAWELGSKAGEWLRDSPYSPIRRHELGVPTGYTEDGRPFWTMPDGSVRWNYNN